MLPCYQFNLLSHTHFALPVLIRCQIFNEVFKKCLPQLFVKYVSIAFQYSKADLWYHNPSSPEITWHCRLTWIKQQIFTNTLLSSTTCYTFA